MTSHTRSLLAMLLLSLCGSGLFMSIGQQQSLFSQESPVTGLIQFGLFIVMAAVFMKVFMMVSHTKLHEGDAQQREVDMQKPKHTQSDRFKIVLYTVTGTWLLYLLSLRTVLGIAPFDGSGGQTMLLSLFLVLGLLGLLAQLHWPKRSQHYAFAVIMGTTITFMLIGFKRALFTGGYQDPFVMSLGIISVLIAWNFLFGPWRPQVKVVVLGTFIFWVGMHLFFRESESQRLAHLLAIVVALIPALIWCGLFLEYHKQRFSLVLLCFFAGMLSTAPILFYDSIVRNGAEFHFFLFRIVPESFHRTSTIFVSNNITGITGYKSTVIATLISFMIVGLIEELAKFWVLKKSGKAFFASVDDVMQLAIITAIGFAFAENVLNPSYFIAFIREYLVLPAEANWSGFLGNMLGRSILTNMVHIVSTGVLGYFFGMALFARPYLQDAQQSGRPFFIPRTVHTWLRIPEKNVFRVEMMMIGIVLSIVLHGLFNFLVTIPDILPGNPRTLGQIFGSSAGSPLHYINLLVVPSLFYVVGGFWLLSFLFYKKDCMKERGRLVKTDTYVTGGTSFA